MNAELKQQLKNKDFEIIRQLRSNSRQTLTEISKKTHIPITTLYDKLKLYEKNTIIKHTSILDFTKLGFNAKTQIYLKTTNQQRDRLKGFLTNHDNVNNVCLLSNDYDFSVEGIFEDVEKVREFMDIVENSFEVVKQQIVFVAKDIKKEGFFVN